MLLLPEVGRTNRHEGYRHVVRGGAVKDTVIPFTVSQSKPYTGHKETPDLINKILASTTSAHLNGRKITSSKL